MLTEETIFITGFPGFIATRLLRRLARDGARFLLLVQPSFTERAHAELKNIAEESGRSPSDFVASGFGKRPFKVDDPLSPGCNL